MKKKIFIIIFVLMMTFCCIFWFYFSTYKEDKFYSDTVYKLTSALEYETKIYLCEILNLSNTNRLCQKDEIVYAEDFDVLIKDFVLTKNEYSLNKIEINDLFERFIVYCGDETINGSRCIYDLRGDNYFKFFIEYDSQGNIEEYYSRWIEFDPYETYLPK